MYIICITNVDSGLIISVVRFFTWVRTVCAGEPHFNFIYVQS